MPTSTLLLRPSAPADLPAITTIYEWNVRSGTGTFELEAPDEAEMARRRDAVLGNGWPWLVAERQTEDTSQVVGYAYANHFRPRRAYRFCVEDSIYLAPQAARHTRTQVLLPDLLT